MKKLFVFTLFSVLFFTLKAQNSNPGTLDESFADAGIARMSPSPYFDFISALLLQDDGKIITVGRSRQDGANYWVYASRQNADGSLDLSYGENGFVIIQADPLIYLNESRDAKLAQDGTLIISGHMYDGNMSINKSFILNIDENGFPNVNFGDNGLVFSENGHGIVYESVEIDSNGRILVCGYKDDKIYLIRYTSNGEIDNTFGVNGETIIEFDDANYSYGWNLAFDENENIIVVASKISNTTNSHSALVCRLDSNGNVDESFGLNGFVDLNIGMGHEYPLAVKLQPSGDYIVAGHSMIQDPQELRYEVFYTRITPDGSVDNAFGNDGYTKLEPLTNASHSCYGLAIAHDGQIFSSFYAYVFSSELNKAYTINLDEDGHLKENFADSGILTFDFTNPEVQVSEAVLQNDGKLLVGGYLYDGNLATEIFVARINTDVEPQEPTVPSEIELEVEVLGATSVKVIAAPNEYTTEYHIGVVSQDEFNELGQVAVVDAIRNDGEAHNGELEFTFAELEANTYYYVVATGLNAENEWGETALSLFRTEYEGVEEMNNDDFRLFPNPASSMILVETDSDVKACISIHDLTGRCVKEMEINGNTLIDVEDLSTGMYFIKIQDADNQIVRKILVE